MRYIKVLLLVILFFLVMMFFVQNQSAFSQAVALKLDLLFLPPVESAPLPFYTLLIICFVLGALCILAMLMWDRVSLSAKLTMANMRARSFEKDVAKALKTNEALQKKLDAAEAKAAQLAEDVENAKKSASALTEQAYPLIFHNAHGWSLARPCVGIIAAYEPTARISPPYSYVRTVPPHQGGLS